MKIIIKTEHGNLDAEIDEEMNEKTAKAIIDSLPLEGKVMRWGDEIYFETHTEIGEEDARTEMEIGELAYWVEGKCFCIFFGRTPESSNDRPVAASDANPFGRVTGNLSLLRKVKEGEKIRVEKI